LNLPESFKSRLKGAWYARIISARAFGKVDNTLDQICNYLPIGRIGTAGQPTAGQFAAIRAAGYRVVINLAMPDSTGALPNEADLVAEQGITYIHIPVVWEAPTLQDLERFFVVMDVHRAEKVFVHCALNWRVSAFTFLYRVLRLGVPQEEAMGTLLQIWQPNPVWRHFIDQALTQHGQELLV
jgi:protein tyrosine phosphatase (PTP) superfamily phosphohydrolase (DUF442 family)